MSDKSLRDQFVDLVREKQQAEADLRQIREEIQKVTKSKESSK